MISIEEDNNKMIKRLKYLQSDENATNWYGCDQDDDDYEESKCALALLCKNPVEKVDGFIPNVVDRFDDEQFYKNYRMTWSTFDKLTEMVDGKIQQRKEGSVPTKDMLLVALWYLATTESLRQVSSRFGISESSALRYRRIICEALVQLVSQFIKWPEGRRVDEVQSGFEKMARMPNVLGAIDGTHIRVTAPKESEEAYFNRKKYHSIVMQATTDHELFFTDIFLGFSGSVHDSRVWENSHLCEDIRRNREEFLPDGSYLLGDKAYEQTDILMTPFRDDGFLNDRQTYYNIHHSKTRIVVERAFGLLKGKWKRLTNLHVVGMKEMIETVMACCTLHNVVLTYEKGEPNVITNITHLGLRNSSPQEKRNIVVEYLYRTRTN